LAALTGRVKDDANRIRWTVEAMADLDLALAKAKYANDLLGVEPIWDAPGKDPSPGDATFDLREVRHPLLDAETVVPVHVTLEEGTRVLVITGPNTGGKTVVLKTIGLMAVMAQAGLHIPARQGSILPFFQNVFVDIGDEQSIEQSLSTFSSHMTNIVEILTACDEHSLVILDELGAGTDPVEGAALARAILDYLNERHVKAFVATHYSDLKAYAHQTEGVSNACVEFDADTLAPTYKLTIGLPGRSNAFAIARRLGLNSEILSDAESWVAPDARQAESLLLDIQSQREAASKDREMAARALSQAEKRLAALDDELEKTEAERRRLINEARSEVREEIELVREQLRSLERQWRERLAVQDRLIQEHSEDGIDTELSALEAQVSEIPAPEPPAPRTAYRGPLKPGDQVWVIPYGAVGEVVASRRGEVDVQLGRFRATVRRSQVDLHQSDVEVDDRGTVAEERQEGRMTVSVGSTQSPGMELDLRGQTSDEGLHRLELYLDDAYLAGLPWVRIIHGRGSGVMRSVVRDAVRSHPLVASYRPGEGNEGGDGVTIVKLATG
jgi:DNA mismatch repair protein MutS2